MFQPGTLLTLDLTKLMMDLDTHFCDAAFLLSLEYAFSPRRELLYVLDDDRYRLLALGT